MTSLASSTREFTESYIPEDAVLQTARARAGEFGIPPLESGGGAALRLLAAAVGAKSVVEVGTGTGVSGVWLLRGMRTDGILTTIDLEPEYQRLARQSFAEAGFAPSRTRIIAGRALDVLPGSPTGCTTWSSSTATRPSTPSALSKPCGCSGRAERW